RLRGQEAVRAEELHAHRVAEAADARGVEGERDRRRHVVRGVRVVHVLGGGGGGEQGWEQRCGERSAWVHALTHIATETRSQVKPRRDRRQQGGGAGRWARRARAPPTSPGKVLRQRLVVQPCRRRTASCSSATPKPVPRSPRNAGEARS